VVATWNYGAVYVQRQVQLINKITDKTQTMALISDFFENAIINQKTPWKISTLKPPQLTNTLNAITIFKIMINQINGNFKLSQNKSKNAKQKY